MRKNGFVTLTNLQNELVSIPKERLLRSFATKQIEEHYGKKRVFAMSGVLVYPCNMENKSYAHIAWRGSMFDGQRVIPVGFYDLITGTFIDVPLTYTFVPFGNLTSNVGSFKYTTNGDGNIIVEDGKMN